LKILRLDNVGLAFEIIIGKLKNQESKTKKDKNIKIKKTLN
jgi:hypothetical protein